MSGRTPHKGRQGVYLREPGVQRPGEPPHGQPRRRRARPGRGRPYQRDGAVLGPGGARIHRDVPPYPKHLHRYVNEFSGRPSGKAAGVIERMGGIVRNLVGKRLTCRQQLVAGNALCGRLRRQITVAATESCARRIPANDLHGRTLQAGANSQSCRPPDSVRQDVLAVGAADGRQAGGVLIAIIPGRRGEILLRLYK